MSNNKHYHSNSDSYGAPRSKSKLEDAAWSKKQRENKAKIVGLITTICVARYLFASMCRRRLR